MRGRISVACALIALITAGGCAKSEAPPEGEGGTARTGPFADFHLRRVIKLSPGTPADYPVAFTIDHAAMVAAGHALDDGSDVQLGYEESPGAEHVPIERVLESSTTWNSATTVIWFRTRGEGLHYLYYAAAKPDAPLDDPAAVFDLWDGFDGDALDDAWSLYTVGGATGDASVSDGAARLSGVTGNIGGMADDMVLLAREMSGDFVVDVSLRSAGGSLGADAKAGGIMARQSPLGDARFVMAAEQQTPHARLVGVRLFDADDATTATYDTEEGYPLRFSLQRIGSSFELFYSTDAISWIGLGGPLVVEMMDPVLVGVPLANISAGSGFAETDYFRMRRTVLPTPTAELGAEEAL